MNRTVLLVTLPIALACSGQIAAQEPHPRQPDTAAQQPRILDLQPRVRVEEPTVVAFTRRVTDPTDTLFASYRRLAEELGFSFVVTSTRPIVLDVRYNAVHYVPEGVPAGFVLLVPGRPSDLIRGLVDPNEFVKRLRAYVPIVRSF